MRENQRCDTCNAFIYGDADGPDSGTCRAEPAQVVVISTKPLKVGAWFPPMKAHGWCRKWQPKDEAVQ